MCPVLSYERTAMNIRVLRSLNKIERGDNSEYAYIFFCPHIYYVQLGHILVYLQICFVPRYLGHC